MTTKSKEYTNVYVNNVVNKTWFALEKFENMYFHFRKMSSLADEWFVLTFGTWHVSCLGLNKHKAFDKWFCI